VNEANMAATINKQRLLMQLFSAVPRAMEVKEETGTKAEPRPVLEQFLYALCREGTTRAAADRAFRRLQENFFDWNEIRVSSVREVADHLDGLPHPETRAHKIISFLQEVFETTYSFDLESLHKKGLKLAAKQLSRYEVAGDYHVSWVIQQSLGGHSLPLDEPSLRVLRRVGLAEEEGADLEALRTSLEHQVPKAKGPLFTDLISNLAAEFCWAREPQCSRCPLAPACPKVLEAAAPALGVQSAARSNSR
jgi:endonuclease-3